MRMEKTSKTSDTCLSSCLQKVLWKRHPYFLLTLPCRVMQAWEYIKDQMLALITMIPWS